MRLSDIIVEKIDGPKTLENYGKAIVDKLIANGDMKWLTGANFTSYKPEDLKGSILLGAIAKVLVIFKKVDPTPNDKYVLWLIKTYVSDRNTAYPRYMFKLQDVQTRIADALPVYIEAVKTKFFAKVKKELENPDDVYVNQGIDRTKVLEAMKLITLCQDLGRMDFYQLENFGEAVAIYEDYTGSGMSNKHNDKAIRDGFYETGDAELIYDDDDESITEINTYEAMAYFGKRTRWCVAAKNNGKHMFDDYKTRGEMPDAYLIISLRKATNEKWLLYYRDESHSDEFFRAAALDYYSGDEGDEYEEEIEELSDSLRHQWGFDTNGEPMDSELRDATDDPVVDPLVLPKMFAYKYNRQIEKAIIDMPR